MGWQPRVAEGASVQPDDADDLGPLPLSHDLPVEQNGAAPDRGVLRAAGAGALGHVACDVLIGREALDPAGANVQQIDGRSFILTAGRAWRAGPSRVASSLGMAWSKQIG